MRLGLEYLAPRDSAVAQDARLEARRRNLDLAALLRVQRDDALDDVVGAPVQHGLVLPLVACKLDERFRSRNGRLPERRLTRRHGPVDAYAIQDLRLHVGLVDIDLAGDEYVGLARRCVRRFIDGDRDRIALLAPERDGRDLLRPGLLRHQGDGPRQRPLNLAIEDRRVAELADLPDVEVLLEHRQVRLEVRRLVHLDIERKRLIQVDGRAVNGCRNRRKCGRRQHEKRRNRYRLPD